MISLSLYMVLMLIKPAYLLALLPSTNLRDIVDNVLYSVFLFIILYVYCIL